MVTKVAFPLGELLPGLGFILTHLETDSRAVARFSNNGGTAEQWITEGKQAVKMTRSSWGALRARLRPNEARLPST